jgi:membrane protein
VLFAAVGYELVKRGFSIYLDNFANYDAVYGSIGAIIAFMFFVYVAAVVFLLGAEMAAIWPRARAGGFDSDEPGPPLSRQIRDALAGLFKRNESEEMPLPPRR